MATDLPSKKAQRARFNVGQLCWYCKRPMSPPRATRPGDRPGTEATLDHVVTRGRKGDDHPENILLACIANCMNNSLTILSPRHDLIQPSPKLRQVWCTRINTHGRDPVYRASRGIKVALKLKEIIVHLSDSQHKHSLGP